MVGVTEDVDDVEAIGDASEIRIGGFAERVRDRRVDRDDAVTARLQHGRDRVGGLIGPLVAFHAEDGDRPHAAHDRGEIGFLIEVAATSLRFAHDNECTRPGSVAVWGRLAPTGMCPRRLPHLLVVLLLGLLLGPGCRAPERPRVIRLIDRVGTAQVEGLSPATLKWAKRLDGSLGGEKARKDRHVIAMRLGPDRRDSSQREALPAPAGSRYRMRVELAPGSRLEFAVGVLAPPGPQPGKLRFAVNVHSLAGAGADVHWETTIERSEAERWRDAAVDLSSLAGGGAEIELAADGAEDLHGGWATPVIVPAVARADRPNVILISLDTVRADHLGAWGYSRPTSPHLDRLAAEGFRFAQTIAQSCWTRPSHRAILWGLQPVSRAHHVPHPLAEVLWRAGYQTLAFTGGGQVDPSFGFGYGFERYDVDDWIRDPEALAARLSGARARPFFAFLHTYEPHDPYTDDRFAGPALSKFASPGFSLHRYNALDHQHVTAAEKRYVEALYDGDIAFTDGQVGKLLAALTSGGRSDDTLIVVTSDHGEQFWEHGDWRHGTTLYDHDIHVPLIFRVPELIRAAVARRTGADLSTPRVIASQVRSIDIYPTILDLVDVPLIAPVQGRSLVPLMAGRSLPAVEALSESITHRHWELKSLRTQAAKLIRQFPRRGPRADPAADQLFDLRQDPGETTNLAHREPDDVAFLARRLSELITGGSGKIDDELPADADPELRKQLEALGYLGGDGQR